MERISELANAQFRSLFLNRLRQRPGDRWGKWVNWIIGVASDNFCEQGKECPRDEGRKGSLKVKQLSTGLISSSLISVSAPRAVCPSERRHLPGVGHEDSERRTAENKFPRFR